MKKVLKQRRTTTREEDGSVTEEVVSYAVRAESTPFLMLFTEHLSLFNKLNALIDVKLLYVLAARSEFNTGIIHLSSACRKEIADTLGIGTATLDNSMSRLRKAELISGSHGKYHLNPYLMWKGTTNSRNRALKELNKDIYDRPMEGSGHTEEFGKDKEELRKQRLGGHIKSLPGQTEIFKEGTEEI